MYPAFVCMTAALRFSATAGISRAEHVGLTRPSIAQVQSLSRTWRCVWIIAAWPWRGICSDFRRGLAAVRASREFRWLRLWGFQWRAVVVRELQRSTAGVGRCAQRGLLLAEAGLNSIFVQRAGRYDSPCWRGIRPGPAR